MKVLKDLEHYRLEHRLTQAKLAEMLGVKLLTVQRWLNGKIKPNKINEHQIKNFIEGNREENIDREFIKRHTKNGQFFHASSSWEEHERVNLEYDRSRSGSAKVNAAILMRENYYKMKNIPIKPMDKTTIHFVTHEEIDRGLSGCL